MSAPLLELRNLRKTYGAVVALDDLSLSLTRGEFLTLLGPSGSGKTSTLMMIAGLVAPSGGSILLEGQPIDPLPPYRRDIGVVFQSYALFPHMTAGRNVAFPLEMRRVPQVEIERRVAAALALVGLSGHGDRYPRELSGGQQQRVALARAMVFEPKILLMDEPLGALDRALREQMQLEILRLHRELHISVVYVTHDQEEALVMSDRIAVFNHGRLEQVGPAQELYERPATQFVAGFIGESNFFAGTVVESANGYCQVEAGDLTLLARDGGVATAATAIVAVRPERIDIAPAHEPNAWGTNSAAGTLTEVIYLGRSRKCLMRLSTGQEVSSYQPAGTPEIAPGTAVRLTWSADDATALPASAP
jgi:putative spermidine/putrescine transport system ATP-binding protein